MLTPKTNSVTLAQSPFGMVMPGRSWKAASADGYRFGFGGKEGDGEIKGENNSYDFGARIYDPRLGKWFSIDPLFKDYPAHSPYSYALNNPIVNIDKDGKKVYFFPGLKYDPNNLKKFTKTFIRVMSGALGKKDFSTVTVGHRNVPQNLQWQADHGSIPISNLKDDKVLRKSVKFVTDDFHKCNQGEPLNLVGSSYGSVVAAQTALYIAKNRDNLKISSETEISVTLITSAVSKTSPLYKALINAGVTVIYDEVQDEGDNVTGIAGNTPEEGAQNTVGITLPWLSKKYSGPSILSDEHIHNQRADDPEKAYNAIDVMLSDNELEGQTASDHATLEIFEDQQEEGAK